MRLHGMAAPDPTRWGNLQRMYRLLADNRCTTIRAAHPDYWRKGREGENANQGKTAGELCCWSRACLTPCGAGCAEDCAHVRHAALCVGKRQGCGEEAVTLVAGSRRRCNMQHDRKWPERRPRSSIRPSHQ